MEVSDDFLDKANNDGTFFKSIIIDDEIWFMVTTWRLKHSHHNAKAEVQPDPTKHVSYVKVMLTVFLLIKKSLFIMNSFPKVDQSIVCITLEF